MNLKMGGTNEFYKNFDRLFYAYIPCANIRRAWGGVSSIVVLARIKPLWHDVSAPGLLGYAMSMILGWWVVVLIGCNGVSP